MEDCGSVVGERRGRKKERERRARAAATITTTTAATGGNNKVKGEKEEGRGSLRRVSESSQLSTVSKSRTEEVLEPE